MSLDEAKMIPEMIHITEARVSDRRGVDDFRYPKDTIIVDDRGYFDYKLFASRIDDENHFVPLASKPIRSTSLSLKKTSRMAATSTCSKMNGFI
ncbi:MAG: hypothetical protein WD038_06580 [Balneolales bacterium]